MNKEKILTSNYLDILFEGRNKTYGGYQLRKSQGKRQMRALAVIVLLAAMTTTYSAISTTDKDKDMKRAIVYAPTNIPQPPIEQPKPKPPVAKQKPIEKKIKAKKFTQPKIEDDEVVKENEMPPTKDELKDAVIGKNDVEGDSASLTDYVVDVKKGDGLTGGNATKEPVVYVDQMPETPYDINAYLRKNLKYPRAAVESNIEGRVIVRFIVNEDGSIEGAEVKGERRYGGGLEEEALRVVRTMPKWKPGKQNGTPVRVYFVLPISFVLQ